jgi:hypothetical protein
MRERLRVPRGEQRYLPIEQLWCGEIRVIVRVGSPQVRRDEAGVDELQVGQLRVLEQARDVLDRP